MNGLALKSGSSRAGGHRSHQQKEAEEDFRRHACRLVCSRLLIALAKTAGSRNNSTRLLLLLLLLLSLSAL